MGPERLRDRVRGAARPVRPDRRALPPRARLPARRRAVRRRVRGVRRREQPADVGRVPRRAGRGSGAADADLARTDPGDAFRPSAATAPCGRGRRSAGWRRRSARSIGGLLVAASWRWVFFVNVPIGLLALVVGWRRLPHVPGQPVSRPDASRGAADHRRRGRCCHSAWSRAARGAGATPGRSRRSGGASALALFAAHTAWSRNPLIDRALFKLRPFTGASAVALLFSASFGGMLLSRVLWAQDVWHWSPLTTGLSIAPGPLMVPLFSFLVAGRLIARLGAGRGDRHRARRSSPRASPGGRSRWVFAPTTSARCSAGCC